MVKDGDAVGVLALNSAPLAPHLRRAFGVDVPVVSEKSSQPSGEGFGVSEGLQGAMKAKLTLTEVAF